VSQAQRELLAVDDAGRCSSGWRMARRRRPDDYRG
jgi:hypothetical protein